MASSIVSYTDKKHQIVVENLCIQHLAVLKQDLHDNVAAFFNAVHNAATKNRYGFALFYNGETKTIIISGDCEGDKTLRC